jgi:transposase-like protein
MVGSDVGEVERELREGRLCCPRCRGALHPWGHARARPVRGRVGTAAVRVRPRRSRCAGCAGTHVLLVEVLLCRRADVVGVIGSALTAKAGGAGHRRIAAVLGRAASTVRGWLRRFAAHAERVRVVFTGLAHAFDPALPEAAPSGSRFADAVAAIGAAARAASLRLGPRRPWPFAARVSGGRLLGPVPINPS